MVNSRMHALTCARIFYSKSSLVSTHFAQITREKVQHESRRKAGGNLHLRSAVVDLRVQLVGTFTFFLFICVWSSLYVALFLSLSLSVYVKWNSNREPLFILFGMGSKLYPWYCLLYALYVRSFSRISTDNNLLFLSPSLSCDKRNKHAMCTKGSKR